MTTPFYERVRNLFQDAGLTDDFTIQLLTFRDSGKIADQFMVFRPNGGTAIRNDLSSEYYVLVDVVGAKDKNGVCATRVQEIIDYVQVNPFTDECLGKIENIGGIPAPVLTDEGRLVFRLLFSCAFGS